MANREELLRRCGRKRVERVFMEALLTAYPQVGKTLLVPGLGYVTYQARCGRYLIDFAIIGERSRIAIEIDEDHHRFWKSLHADERRQEVLANDGWEIVRFRAEDVLRDASGCVSRAAAIAKWMNRPFEEHPVGPLYLNWEPDPETNWASKEEPKSLGLREEWFINTLLAEGVPQ